MDNEAVLLAIKKLTDRVETLETRKIYQWDVTNDVIKNRAMGEPNSYIFSGLEADLPETGVILDSTGFGRTIYFAYDTSTLYIWGETAPGVPGWVSVVLT